MNKTTPLAVVGALALTALLSIGAPTAEADVGISIGIPIPGLTFYAPVPPPPVYYTAPPYYPQAYYAPPAYYGPSYGTVYYGRGYGGGWGYPHRRGGRHHHKHGCGHANHW